METVHRLCTLLKRWEALAKPGDCPPARCLECPDWEPVKVSGRNHLSKRGCRLAAEEFLNVATTGNPWGTPGKDWPPPVAGPDG